MVLRMFIILKARMSLKVRSCPCAFATHDLKRLAEDLNASLISQTLNTDGTPKRPMNAFMIFARRRRPQVSAENQSMRTGEISKILSKEWNAMELVNTNCPFPFANENSHLYGYTGR